MSMLCVVYHTKTNTTHTYKHTREQNIHKDGQMYLPFGNCRITLVRSFPYSRQDEGSNVPSAFVRGRA